MSGGRHGSVHAASGQLLAFLGGDQPHPTPYLAARVDAANGRFAQRSRASDQLANESFRYTTAPQSHASLPRSDIPADLVFDFIVLLGLSLFLILF